ncbi:energy-coupling factor ABC transporter ATP-binding protein [Variovorax sp. J22R115]|uniref:energy-coupling factor ABC transporter ATP-binding protein n=1 Tax=Variovorax sp. J22R115 TaxID=3053509 RepID=UPI002577764F|nr:ABC transporter ATP-binding protein [Variovorax sp. J22R115]MDM0050733.1 ABC transporter ATP-binding protein [Variovorax sp. J22R115]
MFGPVAPHGVRIEAVTLVRGNERVFDDLTLNLQEARIGLIGDNGAGKSSLFRLISGLDAPQQGRVVLSANESQEDRRRRPSPHVGLMFQNPDDQIIFPTVAEELAFSLTARGQTRDVARQQVREFLARRGMDAWAGRAIGELSQGQRQQVCLLALQISEPATLLLDEPFASLDLPSQARLAAQLEATQQQVILSTHLLEHVHGFERVLWLERGSVCADGPGREVCEAYAEYVRQRVRAEQGRHA